MTIEEAKAELAVTAAQEKAAWNEYSAAKEKLEPITRHWSALYQRRQSLEAFLKVAGDETTNQTTNHEQTEQTHP